MKIIEKCIFCGSPFWEDKDKKILVATRGICPDCIEKADNQEQKALNKLNPK